MAMSTLKRMVAIMSKKKECMICGKILTDASVEPYLETSAARDSKKTIFVCKECVSRGYSMLSDGSERKVKLKKRGRPIPSLGSIPSPGEIYSSLSKRVIGQEKAKIAMALFGYGHLKRIEAFSKNLPLNEIPEKTNVWAIGPTGCGKSFLAEALSEILDIPFVLGDASALTESGYCGADVEEDLLKNLIYAAGGSIRRAEIGVICIDEIDKLSSGNTSNKAMVSREGVQMRLLKIIEGQKNISLNIRGNARNRDLEKIDTGMISFVATGAFSGISVLTRKESTIGFRGNFQHQECDDICYTMPDDNDILNRALIEWGMLPELVGRFNSKVVLEPLSVENMVEILEISEDSIIRKETANFHREGIELKVSSDVTRVLAERAFSRKEGARGLNSVLQEMLSDIKFRYFGKTGMIDLVEITTDEKGMIIVEEGKKNSRRKNSGIA